MSPSEPVGRHHPGPDFQAPQRRESPASYSPTPRIAPPQATRKRVPLTSMSIVFLVVLGCTGLALWFPGGGAPGGNEAWTSAELSRPKASSRQSREPAPEPTQSTAVSEERVPPDEFTARRWYGNDKTISYSNGDTKATMHVRGTWDHKTCTGAGRSPTGRKALDNGGCLYGIEIAMEHKSGMFWIDQRVFAYQDQAAAKAASGVLQKYRIAQDVIFGIPEIRENRAVGIVDTFGRCMVIATAAFDLDEMKKLDKKAVDRLQGQAVAVWTSTTTEPVNAFEFGAHQAACG